MFRIPAFTVVLCALLTRPASAQTAIICLTYDDGLPSHLSTVIPQLDSAGLKATFFLNAVTGASTHIGEASPVVTGWKNAAQRGHELGNHTLFHPCPTALGWAPDLTIENYTLAKLLQEITAQGALLNALDPARTSRPYAYPCNNMVVEGKEYTKVLRERKLFTLARAGGDSTSVVGKQTTLDPLKVPSWLVEESTSLEALIRFAEKARAMNGMAVYQFHGIGAEFFRVEAGVHAAFLRYLATNPDKYRVLPFSAGIAAFNAARNGSVQ